MRSVIARDAAVAFVEGVDGDKPQMLKAGLQYGIHRGVAFEPVQECIHFAVDSIRGRGFVVNPLPSHGAGDDLHWPCAVVPPSPGFAPGWEERCMPPEETIGGEGVVEMARGVEHHFDNAFDVPVCGSEGTAIDPEATGDGRADLPGVQLFALYLTAFEDIARKGLEDGLLLEVEAEPFHASEETALAVAGGCEGFGFDGGVPMEPVPIAALMDVLIPHPLRRIRCLFSAGR